MKSFKVKLIFSIFGIALFSQSIYCQSKVEGIIKDFTNNTPLPYVTVSLFTRDSVFITGTTTNDSGSFYFINLDKESYLIRCSYVGYKEQWVVLNKIQANPLEIRMSQETTELSEVTVTGNRPAITNKGERLIVNLNSFMNTAGKNSIDVLRLLPGTTLERESLNLMGKNVAVYIDGRPSHMSGAVLMNYLSSLQGDQIDKVELIANPSAQFEAGFSGAIINIILKKDKSLGFNASLGVSSGAGDGSSYVIPNLNFNYKTNKINILGMYSFMYNDFISKLDYTRKYHNLLIPVQYDEHGNLDGLAKQHSYSIGVDYSISPKHVLGFLIKGNTSKTGLPNYAETKISNMDSDKVDSLIVSPITTDRNYNNMQFNLNYKWIIDDIGSTISSDLNYMQTNSKNEQLIPMSYYDNLGNEIRPQNGNGQNVHQDMNLWSAKIDYHRKFWIDGVIDAGIKYDNVERTNDLVSLQNNSGNWTENNTQSNRFEYSERIAGIYMIANKKFGRFTFNSGIRGEFTQQKGNQITNNESFANKYFDLFPSLSIQADLTNHQSLTFAYSRKLSRPSFMMLNPFKFYTSPQTFQVGNPKLSPNYYETFSVQYLKKQFNLTFQYLFDDRGFGRDAIQNDQTKELGYHYINMGINRRYRLSAFLPVRLFSWWRLNLNASITYNYLNTTLNKEVFKKHSWVTNGSINNTFDFGKGLSAQLYAMVYSDRWDVATHIKPAGYMEASIQQELWKGKGYVTLGVTDPLRWSVFRSTYQYQNIDESAREIMNSRSIKVSFRYNFGIGGSNNTKRKTGVEETESRSQ